MEIWKTVATRRTVLVVLHNITTLDRMLDVLGVLAGDLRVQLLVTSELSDPFADDLPEAVTGLGLRSVPWPEAVRGRFDLIVSASHHGGLDELTGPLLILPHGAGLGKYAPGDGERSVFGLGPEWLLRRGRPFAAALGFAHDGEIARLARDVPAALPAAVLVGDPAFDRLRAMPAGDDGTVLVTSTWGPRSLVGTRPGLPRELAGAGLRVRVVLHPNIWAWHGAHQVRAWLAGLDLVPPLGAWRAAVAGAACVVGDHGSVTAYGAALGKPTLLAAFPDADVVPGSPAHRVGLLAPRLADGVDPAGQVAKAVEGHDPAAYGSVAGLVSSVPGEAAIRLRRLCYRLLEIEEPC